MREYEILYILKPDLDDDAVTANMERFKDIVEKNNGSVTNLEKWGKRKLAYEIKDYKEGIYILMNFKGTADIAGELDRVMRISEPVLRQMIVLENL